MILIWYQGRRLRVLPWSSTNLWWLWIEIREAAGTEVITLTMRKWLSRAPEKPSQFLSPSEGGQPEVGGDISAQGCRVRHKMNQGNSISSLIWITALNLCLSCSQSLAPSSGNTAIGAGSPYSVSFGGTSSGPQRHLPARCHLLYITRRVEFLVRVKGLCHLAHPRNQSDLAFASC